MGRRQGRGRTRYQPVGFPVLPISLCEVRTTRTFGAMIVFCEDIWYGRDE